METQVPPWGSPLSLSGYAEALRKAGTPALWGESGMLWARYDSAAMIRLPMFHFSPVSGREIRQVLWQGPSTLVSYLMAPNEDYPVNAWLYVCRDQSYSLDRLSKEARRDARRQSGGCVLNR
jgi:hypothetical protein